MEDFTFALLCKLKEGFNTVKTWIQNTSVLRFNGISNLHGRVDLRVEQQSLNPTP